MKNLFCFLLILLFSCAPKLAQIQFQVTAQFVDTDDIPSAEFLKGTAFENLSYAQLKTEDKGEEVFTYTAEGLSTISFYNKNQKEPDFNIDLFSKTSASGELFKQNEVYKEFGFTEPSQVQAEIGQKLKIGQILQNPLEIQAAKTKIINSEMLVSGYAIRGAIVISVLTAKR